MTLEKGDFHEASHRIIRLLEEWGNSCVGRTPLSDAVDLFFFLHALPACPIECPSLTPKKPDKAPGYCRVRNFLRTRLAAVLHVLYLAQLAWNGACTQWSDDMRPLITSLMLLLAASLSAQTFDAPSATLSPAPKRSEQVFSKKIFWTEVGAYTLSNVLDGYTTVAHPEGYEEAGFPEGSAFLLGQHPSAARYVATMGALQVATSFAAYRLQHSQKRFLRLLGHALMIQGIYAHTDGYIGNVLLLNQGLPQAKPARRGPHKEPF